MKRTLLCRLHVRLLLLILVSVAPAFVIITANSLEERARAVTDAHRLVLELGQRVVAHERDLMAHSRQLLQSLAHTPEVISNTPAACRELLADLRRVSPYYLDMFVAGPDGGIRCSASPLPDAVNVADRAYFRRAVETRTFAIGEYQLSRVSGKPTLVLAVPVLDNATKIQSVVAIGLDFDWIRNSLTTFWQEQEQEQVPLVTLVDRRGALLARMPDSAGPLGQIAPEVQPLIERAARVGPVTDDVVWLDGVRRITALVPLQESGSGDLFVRVGISESSVLATATHQFGRSIGLMGLAAVLSMGLGWLASDRLVLQRVKDLIGAIRRLGLGDLAARTRQRLGRDELGQLECAFDLMAEELQLRENRVQRTTKALQASQLKLTQILASVDNLVWSVNARTGELAYLNPVAERIYGRPLADFLGKDYLRHEAVHPQDRDALMARCAKLPERGADPFEYRIVRPDGSIRWLENRVTVARDADGQPVSLNGISTDVTERKSQLERIANLSNRDPLTGLPNMQLLMERLGQAMAAAGPGERGLALLVLDIDRLKLIGDGLGYVIGDALLIAIAERLRGVLREIDTAARLGGEEFAMLLPGVTEPERATTAAVKVFDALRRPFPMDGRELYITISLGIALFPRDGTDPEALLNHARSAMRRAQQFGGDAFEFYAAKMTREAAQRLQLEQALRLALEREEFELHYQPRVDLASGRATGMEALIRWRHPDLGLIPPARFIPVAEDTGLIVPIGEWVLRTACAQQRAWTQAGRLDVQVAVNLCARQLWHGDVTDMVARAIRETGIAPNMLELEVTESAMMRNIEDATLALVKLRALGVSVAIDDFGTGYSSLNRLRLLPIDQLKIDQSFVRDLTTHSEVAVIVQTIIDLAHALKLRAVAEGVETREQLALLAARGCDAVQGYLVSRPMPAQETKRWLQQREAGMREEQDTGPAPVS